MDNESKAPMGKPSVRIRYRLVNDSTWHEHSITPEGYYEPEQGELQHDSVPRHFHVCEYLDIPIENIGHTVLEIYDSDEELRNRVVEVLWNRGSNRLISRVENGDRLLVVQIRTQENPPTIHTVRYDRSGDGSGIVEHFLDIEGPGGGHETIISTTLEDQSE
jgi:hypothetical protein